MVTGDLNVAPAEIDIHSPKTNLKSAGTSPSFPTFPPFLPFPPPPTTATGPRIVAPAPHTAACRVHASGARQLCGQPAWAGICGLLPDTVPRGGGIHLLGLPVRFRSAALLAACLCGNWFEGAHPCPTPLHPADSMHVATTRAGDWITFSCRSSCIPAYTTATTCRPSWALTTVPWALC